MNHQSVQCKLSSKVLVPQRVQAERQEQLPRAAATALIAMALTESSCPLHCPAPPCRSRQALLHLHWAGACDYASSPVPAAASAGRAVAQEPALEAVPGAACQCHHAAAAASDVHFQSAVARLQLALDGDRASQLPAPTAAAVTAGPGQTLGADASLAPAVHAGF